MKKKIPIIIKGESKDETIKRLKKTTTKNKTKKTTTKNNKQTTNKQLQKRRPIDLSNIKKIKKRLNDIKKKE